MTTTIQISDGVWKKLNRLKKKGETFQDVLERMLKLISKYKLQRDLEEIGK